MRLTVITPQGTAFDSEVERMQFRSATGLMEFLPGHAPMIAELRAGTIATNQGDVACGDGVVKIERDVITVVCE